MNDILATVRQELNSKSDEKTRISGQRYFKEKVHLYGVKASEVQKLSKEYFKLLNTLSKPEVFDLCDNLWQSGYMEESFIACNWSYYISKQYEPSDFTIFHFWIENYLTNWASCDTLCNHTVGTFIEMFPDYIHQLKKMTDSPNRWTRRASAVSLIIPARRGKFLGDIFEIAGLLLTDKDDMVQKGYGWMLKSASQAHQDEVFGFVMKHKAVMPRTALRYAIEKMPTALKAKAMER